MQVLSCDRIIWMSMSKFCQRIDCYVERQDGHCCIDLGISKVGHGVRVQHCAVLGIGPPPRSHTASHGNGTSVFIRQCLPCNTNTSRRKPYTVHIASSWSHRLQPSQSNINGLCIQACHLMCL